MAYRMTLTPITLSDLEGHLLCEIFLTPIPLEI